MKANPRLSTLDRERLDDHVQRIADLQRRLGFQVSARCAKPARPAGGTANDFMDASRRTASGHAAYVQSFNEVVTAALACDLTRVVTYCMPCFRVPDGMDMHFGGEHKAMERDGVGQGRVAEANRRMFSDAFVPLAAKLDSVVDETGQTLLDRSLMLRSVEMGEIDHTSSGQVFWTMGGAAGAVRTGNFLDYRNLEQLAGPVRTGLPLDLQRQHLGLTIQQFWGSILRVLGIPHAEWAESGHGGYGKRVHGPLKFLDCCNPPPTEKFYTEQVWGAAGDVLPWLGT